MLFHFYRRFHHSAKTTPDPMDGVGLMTDFYSNKGKKAKRCAWGIARVCAPWGLAT